MKDTLLEIENNLQGNNSRMDEAEIISMIWNIGKQKTTTHNKKKKKESKKWGQHKQPLRSNIRIIGLPGGEEKEQEIRKIFEKLMKDNFPNVVKEIDIPDQEAQKVPNKIDAKRPIQDAS